MDCARSLQVGSHLPSTAVGLDQHPRAALPHLSTVPACRVGLAAEHCDLVQNSTQVAQLAKIAQRITGLELQPMPSTSNFVKPESVMFQMDGAQVLCALHTLYLVLCPHMQQQLNGLLNCRQTEALGEGTRRLTLLGTLRPGRPGLMWCQPRDTVAAHPSVACILYHTEYKSLILVRQFRPAVRAALPGVRIQSREVPGLPWHRCTLLC